VGGQSSISESIQVPIEAKALSQLHLTSGADRHCQKQLTESWFSAWFRRFAESGTETSTYPRRDFETDRTYAPPVGYILDPFSASGMTLAAARALGLRAVGIEIEERFRELAAHPSHNKFLNFASASSRHRPLRHSEFDALAFF